MDLGAGEVTKEEIQYDTVDFDDIDTVDNLIDAETASTETLSEDVKVKEIPQKEEETEVLSADADEKTEEDVQAKKDEEDISEIEKMTPKTDKSEFAPFKIKDGKDLVELNRDAKFSINVNGEKKNPTVGELVKYYRTNNAVDKKFSDANTLRQKLDNDIRKHEGEVSRHGSEVGKVRTYAQSFMDNVKGGHMRDAIYDLCRITGEDSTEQWAAFQDMQKQSARSYQEMSEEDLERQSLRDENEFHVRQNERSEKERADLDKTRNSRLEMLEATNKFGITEPSYKKGSDFVDKLVIDKTISAEQATPEYRAEVGWDLATLDLIDQMVGKEFPDRKGDFKLYNEILTDTKAHGLTMDDWTKKIANIKANGKGQERQAAIKRKVSKQKPASPFSEAPGVETKLDTAEWDDI